MPAPVQSNKAGCPALTGRPGGGKTGSLPPSLLIGAAVSFRHFASKEAGKRRLGGWGGAPQVRAERGYAKQLKTHFLSKQDASAVWIFPPPPPPMIHHVEQILTPPGSLGAVDAHFL